MDEKNATTGGSQSLENNGFMPVPGLRFTMRGNDYRPGPRQLSINNQYLEAPLDRSTDTKAICYITSFLHTIALWFLVISPALDGREWGWLRLLIYTAAAAAMLLMILGTSLGLAVPSPRFNRQSQRVYFKYHGHFLALPWSRVRPYVKRKKTKNAKSANAVDLYFIWPDWRAFVEDAATTRACEVAIRGFGIPPHVVNQSGTGVYGMSLTAQLKLFDYIRRFMANELDDLSTIEPSSSPASRDDRRWSVGEGILFLLKSVVYLVAIGPLLQLIFRWSERKARWPDWVERECLANPTATAHNASAPTASPEILYRCVERPAGTEQVVFVDANGVRFDLTRARLWLVTTAVRYIEQRRLNAHTKSATGDTSRLDTSSTRSRTEGAHASRDEKSHTHVEGRTSATSATQGRRSDETRETPFDSSHTPAPKPPKPSSYFDNLDEKYGTSKR